MRVGQRAGRDDADDLALDEALGLARVFDLIADGDAETLLDQARDVAVDRVKRHAAHRDAAAAASLDRDVSVSSSARAATRASS